MAERTLVAPVNHNKAERLRLKEEFRIYVSGWRATKIRVRLGLSQKELAAQLGLQAMDIYLLETGRKDLSAGYLAKYTAALDIHFEEFLAPSQEVLEMENELRKKWSLLGSQINIALMERMENMAVSFTITDDGV